MLRYLFLGFWILWVSYDTFLELTHRPAALDPDVKLKMYYSTRVNRSWTETLPKYAPTTKYKNFMNESIRLCEKRMLQKATRDQLAQFLVTTLVTLTAFTLIPPLTRVIWSRCLQQWISGTLRRITC